MEHIDACKRCGAKAFENGFCKHCIKVLIDKIFTYGIALANSPHRLYWKHYGI